MARIKTFTNVKLSLPESTWTDPVAAYSHGYMGAWPDPEGVERLHSAVEEDGGKWNAEDVVYGMGAAGQGAGKLSLLTEEIARVFGRQAMPGPPQTIGDCVARATINSVLGTVAAHVAAGVQGKPDVPPEAVPQGVFATEILYSFRSSAPGDGWSCSEAVLVAMKKTGAVVRQNYPSVGVDLSRYSAKVAHRWGAGRPSAETMVPFGNNLVSSATRCRSWEEVRDMIASGHGVSSCGGEGWAPKRDEWGVSERQGRWAHAMAILGADDRPETHRLYGGPLLLFLNSWSAWNTGSRAIRGTHLSIPEGAFWARFSDAKNRDFFALAVNGWSNAKLKPWAVDV